MRTLRILLTVLSLGAFAAGCGEDADDGKGQPGGPGAAPAGGDNQEGGEGADPPPITEDC